MRGPEPVPSELLAYVQETFAPETEALRTLTAAAERAGMPAGWEVTPDVGRLFQVLCRSVGARRVLEFGTLAGHSAWWLATALPDDGQVVSIEIDPAWAEAARQALAEVGVASKVDVRVGAVREIVGELEREVREEQKPYDAVFLDADKAYYPELLEWSTRVLRPGGLLLADNVLRSGSWNGQALLDPDADDPRILAIRRFNRLLAEHPHFTATIVPIRAGIAVGVYLP
ncbi:MAG: O-methyltransferase [Chthonomonadaceae bacterium]|nr:O-methyltransferase [Chthonomonadaceae bacterium]